MVGHPPLAHVFTAISPADTWVHLAEGTGPGEATLCGVSVSPVAPRQWYALAGCKACARAALDRGLDHVADIDGSEVSLQQIVGA